MNSRTKVPKVRRPNPQRRKEAMEKLLEAAVSCVAQQGLDGSPATPPPTPRPSA